MNSILEVRATLRYGEVQALSEARLTVGANEIVGLVGASGSGKSSLASVVMGLHRFQGGHVTGKVLFEGVDLLGLSERELRLLRGKRIALIPQSPMDALNPHLSIEQHFRQAWQAHREEPWRPQVDRVLALGRSLGLDPDLDWLQRKGNQFSVGQAQRILIAMALLHEPRLLIADEPTSALDPISAADVVNLLRQIGQERHLSVLFISHDLPTVSDLCHRIAVMYQGEIVEEAAAPMLITQPQHPYTKALLRAIPSVCFRSDTAALAAALAAEPALEPSRPAAGR